MLIRSSIAIPERAPAYVDKDLEAMVKRHAVREKSNGQNILGLIRLMKSHGLKAPNMNAVESSEMADEIAELFAGAPDAVPDWAQEPLQQYFDDLDWSADQYDEIIAMQATLRERYKSNPRVGARFNLPAISP